MILYSRLTRTDSEFTRDDDLVFVDTTAGDVAIAIPNFASAPVKPINPIIRNSLGLNNVVISTNDPNVLIEGQRAITLLPGETAWLSPIFDDNAGTVEYRVIVKVAFKFEGG